MKSGLNKKNRRYGLLNYTQVFYTSRGGGSKAPIRRTARWGLLVKLHGTSLKNFNFNPRVCFYDYFLHGSYGPSYVKHILSGVKNSNDSIETRHDNFSHKPLSVSAASPTGWNRRILLLFELLNF